MPLDRRWALALTSFLVASGCLGASPPAGGGADDTGDGVRPTDAAVLAFHQWSTCGLCHGGRFENPEQRLFVALQDGVALLFHYGPGDPADGPPPVRFHDDVPDQEEIRRIAGALPLQDLHARGALWVARVDVARLPDDVLGGLRDALARDWAKPPEGQVCPDCEGRGVYGMHDNGTWRTLRVGAVGDEEDPAARAFLRLDHAFRRAEAVLDPTRAPSWAPPEEPDPTPADCIQWDVTVAPPSPAPGEGARVNATLRNACEHPLEIQGTNGCTVHGLDAAIHVNGTPFWLTGNGSAADGRACAHVEPPLVTVPPHGEHHVTWWWNGTLQPMDPCCGRYTVLPPGAYDVRLHVVRPDGLPAATARLEVHGPAVP